MSDARANAKIYERRNKKLRKLNTIVFPAIILFIAIIYVIFFTSSYWMPQQFDDLSITKIGSIVSDNSRNVTLLDWSYSSEENTMEIYLEIDNQAYDGVDRYLWSAVDWYAGDLNVVPIVEKNDFVVLQIQDPPQKISVISLRMNVPETAGISWNTVRLYGDPDQNISSVEKITELTESEYEIKRMQIHISNFTKEISDLESANEDLSEQINNLLNTIEETRQSEAYQTQAEIENTEQHISRLNNQIGLLREQVSSNNKKIQENREKIENRSEQIQILEGESSDEK